MWVDGKYRRDISCTGENLFVITPYLILIKAILIMSLDSTTI